MKSIKFKSIGLLITGLMMLVSCEKSSSTSSKERKPWTQEQREEYMKDCIFSAKAGYEQKGMEPDKESITNICTCTGQKIEAKYGYDETSKMSEEEMREFVIKITKECASQK